MILLGKNGWTAEAEAICERCGGRCCTDDTQPPVSDSCCQRLIGAGIPRDFFEFAGYRRLRLNGHACILFAGNRCRYHRIKPETCRAGPFTFDIGTGTIEMFLKTEDACPLVRLLKENPAAYREQYETAVTSIRALVADLPDEELAAVCRIEEPATVHVCTIPRNDEAGP